MGNLALVRVLVVMNPRATATTAREREVLVGSLSSVAEVEVVHTANRGHAAALACRAMRGGGTDAVIAVGGDGTVNEVVNGLLTDGVHGGVPALGVVPLGSTNVFARAVGLPNDPVEATGALLDALQSGSRRSVSMGKVDDRWFVFAAGIGFDGAIVAGVEKARAKGKKSTHTLYARVGFSTFLRTDRRHPHLTVELPDGTVREHIFMAIVTNTDPWTFVGNRPLRPTPDTGFEDGLAVYARRRMGTPGILFSFARLSGSRAKVGRRGAHVAYDLPTLVVRSDIPMPVQIDGDYIGEREKLVFTSASDAVDVLV
jgi:diacylglycerol kinase family enzyme